MRPIVIRASAALILISGYLGWPSSGASHAVSLRGTEGRGEGRGAAWVLSPAPHGFPAGPSGRGGGWGFLPEPGGPRTGENYSTLLPEKVPPPKKKHTFIIHENMYHKNTFVLRRPSVSLRQRMMNPVVSPAP